MPRCFPSSFLKSVEHIDRFRKLANIAHSVFQSGVNPDLADPGSNARHRLPIERSQPLLNQSELKPGESPGIPWESSKVSPRGPKPQDRLLGHSSICKF